MEGHKGEKEGIGKNLYLAKTPSDQDYEKCLDSSFSRDATSRTIYLL